MQKRLIGVLLTYFLSSCSVTQPEMAIGDIADHELFAQYASFAQEYRNFQVTTGEQQIVSSWPRDVAFKIYFATWCHDSMREVPRLLKLLNGQFTAELIALNFQKQEPAGRAQADGIAFTPTIILQQAGQEVGRIVEKPERSLVADLDRLIKNRQ